MLSFLSQHEANKIYYSQNITDEIDFISSHFFNLCETHQEELKSLSFNTLYQIISNPKLGLTDEDQLVKFFNIINRDIDDPDYGILYNFIIFANVESSTIEEFIDIFNYNNLTYKTWKSPSNRLKHPLNQDKRRILINIAK